MIRIIRTDSTNNDFKKLIKYLDEDLKTRDSNEEYLFYDQFNNVTDIRYVVVAYKDNNAIACGAIKGYDDNTVEIKRMFVKQQFRRRGIAKKILSELETWAIELGFLNCILETGINQPEAVYLYKKLGYIRISNYAQYIGAVGSICFKKNLNKYNPIGDREIKKSTIC